MAQGCRRAHYWPSGGLRAHHSPYGAAAKSARKRPIWLKNRLDLNAAGRGAGVGAVLDGIGHLVLRLHGVGGALSRRRPLPRHRELHRSLELCAGGKADVGASGAAGRHPPAADAAVLGSPSGRPTEHSRAIHHSGQPRGNPGRPGPGRDAAHGRRREASARVSRYSSAACRHTS